MSGTEAAIAVAEPVVAPPNDEPAVAVAAPAADPFVLALGGAPAASEAGSSVAPLTVTEDGAPIATQSSTSNDSRADESAPPVAVGVLVNTGRVPVGSGNIPVVSAGPVVVGRGTLGAVGRPASAPPLRIIAEILREQLDLKGNVAEVVRSATRIRGSRRNGGRP